MKITRTLVAFLILIVLLPEIGFSQTTYTWSSTSTAWLTAANWSPSGPAGSKSVTTNNDIAFFNSNTQPTAQINMNTQGGAHYMGALNFGTSATTARTVNNSSGTVAGTLYLNGVTLNSVSNTIIWNQSTGTHVINDGSNTMNLGLNNGSDNVIQITGTGGITISSVITGASKNLTKAGSGSGVLILGSAANAYSGTTTITAGELRLNPSVTTATFASQIVLNGGTLSTTGIAASTTMTSSSTLNLTNSSTIALGSNAHSLKFAASNGVSWTSGKTITITGWTGTIGAGTTGTAGKIFFGTSASGLTAAQLCQIQFTISGTNYPCALLSTGELVPVNTPTTTSISPSSATAGGAGFTITVNGTNFVTGVSTVTWGGSARTTTFVSSTQLTATINAADIASSGTAAVGVTSGCQTSNTQTFTINPSCSNPTIGTQPTTPQSACLSNSITYTVAATGTSLTYQWQKSATGSGGWSNVSNGTVSSFTYSGATTTSLVVSSSATATEYYQCIVSSGACNTTSSVAQFNAISSATAIAPTTTQNLSVSVSGSTLTVTEGSTPTSRQWYYGTSTGGPYTNAISGETNSTYTPNFGSAGSYYVVCKSTYGSPCSATVTSNEVLINVTANTITTSSISGSPFCSGASVSVLFTYSPAGNFPSGGSCTFTAELSDASGSFGSPTTIGTIVSDASGSQTVSATIPGGTTTGTGYRIRVTSYSPAVTGSDNGANLTINTTVTPSVNIASSPAAVSGVTTICAGTSVTFTATPTNGGASPTYQWKVNGVNAGSGGTTFTTTTLTNGQIVTCDMTSNATCPSSATVTSNSITMTVNALVTPAVSIAITTGTNPLCSGASTVFTATPTNGGASPSYQWKLNGGNVGTNSATYSNSSLANTDAVSCVMTSNATCPSPTTATSNTITITNNTPATPTFTASSSAVALGQTGVVYTVTSVAGVTYNWSYSGTGATITGTGNSVTVDFATTATSGNISVTASKSGCTSTAATVAVTVAPSATSDILADASYSYTSNIAYASYQSASASSTSNSVGVFKFSIRDGAGSADADGLPTILNAITINATNIGNIRSASLFGGATQSTLVATGTVGTNLVFTGLSGTNVTATDGSTKDLTLRITFNSAVTDNQQMQFTIINANTTAAGSNTSSLFSAFSSQISSVTGDNNRIEVTGDRIRFTTQPTDQSVSNNLATFTLKLQDALSNIDLDGSYSVALTTSGISMTSSTPYTLSSGVLNISDVQFTSAPQTGITITGTTSGLSFDNDDVSSTFNITSILYPNGAYRSTSNGTLTYTSGAPAGTATWEVYSSGSGTWSTASTPPNLTTATTYIFIKNNIEIPLGTGSYGGADFSVLSTGVLTLNSTNPQTAKNLHVYGGGIVNDNVKITIASTGTFELDDDATFNFNVSSWSGSQNSSIIWNGTEKFHPKSNFVIQNHGSSTSDYFIPAAGDVSTYTQAGYSAMFGNLIYDCTAQTVAFQIYPPATASTTNLTHGDLIFRSGTGSNNIKFADANLTTTIGGSIIMESGFSGRRVVGLTTANTATINVKGNLINNSSAAFRLMSSTTSTSVTLNVDSNVEINSTGTFDFNVSTSTTSTQILRLKGDLIVASGALFLNTNPSVQSSCIFNGTGDGSSANLTQTINNASTIALRNQYINFNISNGAYVQLAANLDLGKNAKVTDSLGATLDFGFSGSTPLYITTYTTGAAFESRQGSILKITDPDGILYDVASLYSSTIGNVRTITKTNRSYSPLATFWYIGKTNQYTGDGINASLASTGNGRQVIVDLIDNNTSLTPDVSFALSNDNTLSATGGKLDIRKGQFIETNSARVTANPAYITGSTGTLYMSRGTLYKIVKGNSTASSSFSDLIPRMDGTSFSYTLIGGTIELAGAGSLHVFQTLRGSKTYKNIKYSGTNSTYSYPTLTDYKNLSSNVIIDSSLIITNGAIVDCIGSSSASPTSFTGNGGLIMSGTDSRLRMNLLNTTLPELLGTAISYSLTGGTVEWYGTSSSQTHSLRGTDGNSANINYFNVDINASGANVGALGANVVAQAGFGVAGTMNVNSPACFQLGSGFTITDAGTSTFEVKPGATFKYGGSIATSGATGNVRTDTRTFPTTASYGFVGSVTPQDPGSGLPSSMVNMYLDKTNAGDLVTITQDEEMTSTLAFYKGIVKTNSNTMYVSNTSTSAITGGNTSGSDKYVQGRLKRKTDGASTYTFPIGHSTQNAQGFTITPTGTSGSDLLGYLEANSTSPVKTVAYCDLETKTAAGQQIGQGAAGPDGALDQVVFNLASPLQWDITNPGGGVSSYNVTVLGNGGQDISPVTSASGTPIRYLLKNGEPGNTGFATGSGGADYPTVGFLACPNQYTLTGMTSFSKFTLNGANPSGTGLPVKLLFFTGKKVENYSQLDWATAVEIDNDKFIVKRSGDAVHFESIGTVKGAGNTTVQQNYQWLDKSPLSGWNYYRLKQVDFDGDVEYTNTVAVNFDGEEITPSIIVFPSPSKDFINIQILGTNQVVEAVLYNMIGQAVKNVTPNSRMSIEDLPSGEYFIKVIMGNNVVVKQFVKE